MLKYLLFVAFLSNFTAANPTLYTYKTIGNITLQAAVFTPNLGASQPPQNLKSPVVLAIHGGGFLTGGCLGFATQQEIDEMLRHFWVVVSIDYRLSPRFFLPDMIEDVQDAYKWILNELVSIIPINPDLIAVWGGSSGGALAGIAGYQLTPRPKVIVLLYPFCINLLNTHNYDPNTPISDELASKVVELRADENSAVGTLVHEVFGLAFREKKLGWLYVTANQNETSENVSKMLKEYSVVDNIGPDYPPVYIVHGLNDWVAVSESFQMTLKLKKENVVYKIDLVPAQSHLFDGPSLNKTMWDQHMVPLFEFTEKYLTNNAFVKVIMNLYFVLLFYVLY